MIHDAIYCGCLGIHPVVRRGICHGLLGDDHNGRDGADDLHKFQRPQVHGDEQFRESDVHFIQRERGDDRRHELRGRLLHSSTWIGDRCGRFFLC